jgi:hypothetical protein
MDMTAIAHGLMGLAYLLIAFFATRWGVKEFMQFGFIKVLKELLFFGSILMAVLHTFSRLSQQMEDKNSQQSVSRALPLASPVITKSDPDALTSGFCASSTSKTSFDTAAN